MAYNGGRMGRKEAATRAAPVRCTGHHRSQYALVVVSSSGGTRVAYVGMRRAHWESPRCDTLPTSIAHTWEIAPAFKNTPTRSQVAWARCGECQHAHAAGPVWSVRPARNVCVLPETWATPLCPTQPLQQFRTSGHPSHRTGCVTLSVALVATTPGRSQARM